MTTFISDFSVIRPDFEIAQEATLEWLAKAHAYVEKKETWPHMRNKLLKIGLGPDKIQRRGASFPDVTHDDWEKMEVYNLAHSPSGYPFKERTRLYDRLVTDIFARFYPETTSLPSHLIHVTCTGYTAPSGAQKLVANRKAPTQVTHAYHMGCYAAMAALRMAQGFSIGGKNVDIVHTEVCSLHVNPLAHDNEQLVVQTLFADGYIKYTCSAESGELALLALHEEIVPDSLECIGWECHDWGLSMKLSKRVPDVIAKALPSFLRTLAALAGLRVEEMVEKAYFAIHPGGIKIIEEVSRLLNLQPWQIAHSLFIMQNCGNMSSATQPHIWEKMAHDPNVPVKSHIISFAFGPGLTISGGVLQKWSG